MYLNDNIVINEKDGIEILQFKKLLEMGIVHGYTLKNSRMNFRTNNSLREKESIKLLFDTFNLDLNKLVKPIQTHTSNVKCIDEVVDSENLNNVDGLITNKEGLVLVSKNADCILFNVYDPVKRVIANVHSGWRGTFQKIIEKTIVKMQLNYGCDVKDLIVIINPSIRMCHFEVNEDVKILCEEIFSFTKRENDFIKVGRIVENIQKYNIDTVFINKILLMNMGIKEENIIDCEICSVCNSDKIHSRRADGENFGLAMSFICL